MFTKKTSRLQSSCLNPLYEQSLSLDESDENDHVFCENELTDKLNNNTIYRRVLNTNQSSKKEDDEEIPWNAEDTSYIRGKKKFSLKNSFSLDHINRNGEFTTKPDLLKRYGQQPIDIGDDKELAKALLKKFDEIPKGPDVKPPRNERRTLLLSRNDNQGFGFWLQTYKFNEKTGENSNPGKPQRRTFVRYVEDEGAAYLAGLREGDVIVEVNTVSMEERDHQDIVELISAADKELRLVVKFMDAVKRVDLATKLKKKKNKLKNKYQELKKIEKEEEAVLSGTFKFTSTDLFKPRSSSSASISSERDYDIVSDNISLNTSIESETSSMSSLSDEVTVRTSKFEKLSTNVFDSIKELNTSDDNDQMPRVNVTTDSDLLRAYSNKDDFQTAILDDRENSIGFNRIDNDRKGLRRVETMPVQREIKRMPIRQRVIDIDESDGISLEGSNDQLDKTSAYHVSIESFSSYSGKSEDSDSITELENSTSSLNLNRSTRPSSYKLAVKKEMRPKVTYSIQY